MLRVTTSFERIDSSYVTAYIETRTWYLFWVIPIFKFSKVHRGL